VAASRSIIVAGAGIGGLTAALALAAKGFQVTVLEKADRLQEVGAGLQLSPNASRVLIGLGLKPLLAATAIVPDAVAAMSAASGREIVRLPLGNEAAWRAGAPYWVIHRADLQAALAEQAAAHPAIDLRLGCAFDTILDGPDGSNITSRQGDARVESQALALVGADGIWSAVRGQVEPSAQPRFGGLIAWRGTIEADRLPSASASGVQLWMGPQAHLVVYPISAGARINLVAIVRGGWSRPGWSEPGDRVELKAAFAAARWSVRALDLIDKVGSWTRWPLFAMPDGGVWNNGRTAFLGDASHGMLPFAAQGAGMAIEDAAVLAHCLSDRAATVPASLARYGELRRARVARVQRLARQNGAIYHLTGPAALARDLAMRTLGGPRLLRRQAWIYDWRL
jgi:salicylate hydroxylase